MSPNDQIRNVRTRRVELTDDLLGIARELDHMTDVALTGPTGDALTTLHTRRSQIHAQLRDITAEALHLTHVEATVHQETHMNHHRAQGFTLIELLVVIAIIGVLAALLLPTFAGAQKKPYDVAAIQCGRAIVAAQTVYRAGAGTYAEDPNLLGPDVREACRDQGVQIGVHATSPAPTTVTYIMSSSSATTFAFEVHHPRGTGFYRYWLLADDPIGTGNRLNTLFPY